jgi:initiator repB protein
MDEDLQRETVLRLLQMDLEPDAVAYYMTKIDEEQQRCKDSYSQVI